MAILAGDGLLNYAFETALKAFDLEPANPAIGKALQVLAKKAGIYGMIGGQTADIEAENMDQSKVSNDLLLFIHENKTAALIQSSMMIGAILAGACEEDIKAMEKIAYNVGIAFQIQDDILDITSSLEVLGKMTGSDEKNNKVTYVTLNGMEKSKEDVEKHLDKTIIAISAKENTGITELEETIKEMFFHGEVSFNDEIYITNIRQKNSLQDALDSLNLVVQSIEDDMPEDFYSIDLMSAYESLGKMIGESIEDDLVNEIFSKFCMGK